MITFELDNDTWDIKLSESGDIKLADGDLAIATSCANAVRLFTNEAYFDQDRGIPHFSIELGQSAITSMVVLQNRVKQACMGVEGVIDCEVVLKFNDDTRTFEGNASISTINGAKINIEL